MRARELTEYRVDEGVLDALHNVYKTSKMGQQHQASATEAAAEKKFSLNIATLIARAIQSGSVLQQTTPPTTPPTSIIKPRSITNLVKSYVDQLVRQYKWQANPKLKTYSNQLAAQIEASINDPADPEKTKYILASKGAKMVSMIQQAAATPIDQLFSTMYQWEQTGQNGEGRQSSSDRSPPPPPPPPSGEKISSLNVSPADKRSLAKLAEYLGRAAVDPTLFDNPELNTYKEAIKKLAAGL